MGATALRQDYRVGVGTVVIGAVLGLLAARQPLAALLLLVAALGGLVVLARADIVLLVMIAALPWENKLHYPSASLSTVKGIGAAVMLAYLIRLLTTRDITVRLPGLLGIVVALGVWIGISLIASSDPSEGMQKLVRWALFLVFFFLVVQLVDGRAEIRRALRWFTSSVAVAAVYSLWLLIEGHNGFRAAGPLEDPNDFAYLLACTAPLAVYLVTADPQRRLVWSASFVAIIAAMLATFSRGALVGTGALLAWAIVTGRVPLWAIVSGLSVAAIAAVIAFTIFSPVFNVALHQKEHIAQSNTESREALWVAALKLADREPVTGVGPAQFPKEALPLLRNDPINLATFKISKSVTHNSYLEILAENGLPALFLFVAYLVTVWWLLRGVQRRATWTHDADERRLATALQASFLIAIVSATFLSEELTAPFWLLGGLAVVLAGDGGPVRSVLSSALVSTPTAVPEHA